MKLTTAQVVAKRDAASAAGNWNLAEEYEAELERRDAELEARADRERAGFDTWDDPPCGTPQAHQTGCCTCPNGSDEASQLWLGTTRCASSAMRRRS
jgi:hypothetical protein